MKAPRAETHAQERRKQRFSPIALCLVALMGVSLAAHLAALHRDLPLQDTDEHAFVEPAVHIAATGDLNPHWFGHPGSTVIYPLAGLYHVWNTVAHHGPLMSSDNELMTRYRRTPTPFYVIGRLWAITLAVASLPLLFAVAREAANTRVALMAGAIWSVLAFPVHFGRIVRTESAAVFFGLLALWCLLRAWDDPKPRRWLLAGLAVGTAISSRYFMVALLPPLLVAAFRHRRAPYRAANGVVLALGGALVGFVLTTPYFLLDLTTAWHSLNDESTFRAPFASGLSRYGNARWYVTYAIPASLTWPLYTLALIGIVLVIWRRRPAQLLLLLYCGVFLLGISLSELHWQRWSIEVLPVLVIFAALTIDAIGEVVAARVSVDLRARARALVPAVVTAALVVSLADHLVDANRFDRAPDTRLLAREWLQANVPPGDRVLQSASLFNLPPSTIAPLGHGLRVDYEDHIGQRPISAVRADGYRYLVVGPGDLFHYIVLGPKAPAEAAFFTEVACHTRLVAAFPRLPSRGGVGIVVYRLDQRPTKTYGYFCSQNPPADAPAPR